MMHLKQRHRARKVVAFFRSTFRRITHRGDAPSPSPGPDIAAPQSHNDQKTSIDNSLRASEDIFIGSNPDHDAPGPLITAAPRHNNQNRSINNNILEAFEDYCMQAIDDYFMRPWKPDYDTRNPLITASPSNNRQKTSLNNTRTTFEDSFVGSNRDHDAQDPLITASIQNYRSGLLYRLPEELIVMILDQIGGSDDDVITYFCLRHVSRLFRRLVHADPTFFEHATKV